MIIKYFAVGGLLFSWLYKFPQIRSLSYSYLQKNCQYCSVIVDPLFRYDALGQINILNFPFPLKHVMKIFFFEQKTYTLFPNWILSVHLISLPPPVLINYFCSLRPSKKVVSRWQSWLAVVLGKESWIKEQRRCITLIALLLPGGCQRFLKFTVL